MSVQRIQSSPFVDSYNQQGALETYSAPSLHKSIFTGSELSQVQAIPVLQDYQYFV